MKDLIVTNTVRGFVQYDYTYSTFAKKLKKLMLKYVLNFLFLCSDTITGVAMSLFHT